MIPLISAIMPTKNRPHFVPSAIRLFLNQTHLNRELIIVDDGETVVHLIPDDPRIKYIRHEGTIGEKRNAACRISQGEYICHWDDDDWYGPKRMSEQLRVLRQSGVPATGYNQLVFSDDDARRAWNYVCGQGYACGTTLMYRRSTWKTVKFRDIHIGEDNEFIRALNGRLISDSGTQIVARIHKGSTCPKEYLYNTLGGWTGRRGQAWTEIDYRGLATIGYPVMEYSV